jgi:hypothetical protein
VVHHACDANLRCDIRVSDVVTGEQRRVAGAVETPGFDPWGTSVSPDGRFVSWLSWSGSSGPPEVSLNLTDLTTGSVVSALGPEIAGQPGPMTWSPDSQWLFVSGFSSCLSGCALRVGDGAVFEIDLPISAAVMLVTDGIDSG